MQFRIVFTFLLVFLCSSCAFNTSQEENNNTLLVAAAASLEPVLHDAIIPAFEAQYPHITVYASYASSGNLQHQIEYGLPADIFLSADTEAVASLADAGLIIDETPFLQNELVLIAPASATPTIQSLTDLVNANLLAIGDPAAVPAGRYAQSALEQADLWQELQNKLSLATDATQVLHWVSEASADAGLVYASEAARAKDSVRVVSTVPNLGEEIIYPLALLQNTNSARLFYDFLQTDQAAQLFKEAGFTTIANTTTASGNDTF